MKKVFIITNSLGGFYSFRKELLERLLNDSYKIVISSPYDNILALETFSKMGIDILETNIDRRGMNIAKDFFLLRRYFSLLKKEKPDIVLTYTIKPNLYGGLVCKILKVPYITNITGVGSLFQKESLLINIIKKIYKYSLSEAKCVFFQNSENLEFFKENKIIRNNHKLINGSGVNLEKFKPNIVKKNRENFRIIFIGRIMKEKGIDEFLTVAESIKKQNKDIEFFVLGSFEEDNYKEKIKKFEEQNIIKYLGVSSDVREELKKVHCLVNPSWHEGMSNVLLEAGAMKKFLIASNIPGCREIVIDGFTGYTFEKSNTKELKLKIEKLYNISSEEYEEIIENCYMHIKKKFNRDDIVMEYKKIIEI